LFVARRSKKSSSIRLLSFWPHGQFREDHPDYADFNWLPNDGALRQIAKKTNPIEDSRHDREVGTMTQGVDRRACMSRPTWQADLFDRLMEGGLSIANE
jgi:hypothetical protein